MSNTVNLIDPIESVSNLHNGTPKIEDLFIFVELLTKRRDRSVLTATNNEVVLETNLDSANVNMMGVDYVEGKKESAKFTTKWTDNVTNTTKILEGFGIDKIEVVIDSSYIPRVNIEFVDIRGSTFYNLGDNSPYSALFDFPPPIFQMTLKGFYGKSLDYDLHLKTHSTRFNSENGNYYISCEFIARTFAPLADIPFKYTELIALMSDSTKSKEQTPDPKISEGSETTGDVSENNSDPLIPPKNTYELIEKLKNLLDELKELSKNSEEAKDFNEARESFRRGQDIITNINNFPSQLSESFRNGARIFTKNTGRNVLFIQENADTGGDFTLLNSVSNYDGIISASETDGNNNINESTKLYLGVLFKSNREGNLIPTGTNKDSIETQLLKYKGSLATNANNYSVTINESDIGIPTVVINNRPQNFVNEEIDSDEYLALDITSLYIKLKKTLETKREIVKEKQEELVAKSNQIKKTQLGGFKPTIYNVFKILCDDIDKFFKYLGAVSESAEIHHNDFFDQIVNRIKEDKSRKVTKKINAFPLYIKDNANKSDNDSNESPCRIPRKVRAYPDFEGNLRFPETNFIEDLINQIILNKKREDAARKRQDLDASGNNEWIPISPADSELDAQSYESPYSSLELNQTGNDIPTEIYSRVLNRFYFTSQYSYGDTFYTDEDNGELIKFFARAEAVNIANSLINEGTLGKLGNDASKYKRSPDTFFNAISSFQNYSNINDDFLQLQNDDREFYRDKTNSGFTGMVIIDNDNLPALRTENSGGSPVDQYIDNETSFFNTVAETFGLTDGIDFTTENVLYYPDDDKFKRTFIGTYNSFGTYKETYVGILAKYYSNISNFLKGSKSKNAKAVILASYFGLSISYLSDDRSTNSKFLSPALIEAPNFSIYYMGSLVVYNENTSLQNELDDIVEEDWFNTIRDSSDNVYKEDANLVDTYLSDNEKQIFKDKFNEWVNDNEGYDLFKIQLEEVCDNLINQYGEDEGFFESIGNQIIGRNESRVNEIIDSENGFNTLKDDFLLKSGILNFTEYTFTKKDFSSVGDYQSLSELRSDNTKTRSLNQYFNAFWTRLDNEVKSRITELSNIENEIRSNVNDEDIKTQLYYSFKSIVDKWVAGYKTKENGFPLNNSSKDPLISKFAFVDRAMNPIGNETMIDVSALIEMAQDYDLNMFQVFARLLSLNGFEFFPIQNFMSFEDNEWEDTFKPFTTLEQESTPAFVCMYIGGTSSTLENVNSPYDNDGIMDLKLDGLQDFEYTDDCNNSQEVQDSLTRDKKPKEGRFKYSEPKAFRVRFAEQNQSYFINIDMAGREFTETADSLAILSRIAGDGKNASPVPKGQNLFNVYENRAYTVTVKMFGNAMIQPTQYFQLENIPMYSGAYLITKVKHNIQNNQMYTEFTGVKVLKYPNPIVKNHIVDFLHASIEDIINNTDPATYGYNNGSNSVDRPTTTGVNDAIDEADINNLKSDLLI